MDFYAVESNSYPEDHFELVNIRIIGDR